MNLNFSAQYECFIFSNNFVLFSEPYIFNECRLLLQFIVNQAALNIARNVITRGSRATIFFNDCVTRTRQLSRLFSIQLQELLLLGTLARYAAHTRWGFDLWKSHNVTSTFISADIYRSPFRLHWFNRIDRPPRSLINFEGRSAPSRHLSC